jgi:hypothetical protein
MTKTTPWQVVHYMAKALAAVAARLEPKEAAKVAAKLAQAMSRTTDWQALGSLAEGLAVVAARLDPKDAAQAAATLNPAMTRTTEPYPLQSLAQALVAVAARLEAQEAAKVAASLTQAMSKSTTTEPILAQGLAAVLARELPPQMLVDLLKQPFCVGESRRLVLEALGRHYQRSFADQWDFVDFVHQQKLDLDLTTPPAKVP